MQLTVKHFLSFGYEVGQSIQGLYVYRERKDKRCAFAYNFGVWIMCHSENGILAISNPPTYIRTIAELNELGCG